jgi:hypothetical protein
VAVGLVLLSLIQLWLLRPLFAEGEPFGDDLSAHLAEIAEIVRSLREGDLSLWNPSANLGFASGYFYQILPQLVPSLLKLLVGDAVSLLTIFKLAIALPLVLLPGTSYAALRIVGFGRPAAMGGAAAVGVVFTRSVWGNGVDSLFTAGLYTQPWAMLFYPLAIASAMRFLSTGRGLAGAAGFALLTGCCHPFVAFTLLVTVPFTPWWREGVLRGLRRAGVLAALALAVSAFFWLPILVHYDSYGAFPARRASEIGLPPAEFFGLLIRGELLDAGRWPVLTILLVPAVAVAVLRRDVRLGALAAQGAALAAVIMIGPFLGTTKDDLVPVIRFLAPMQVTWALLAGAGAVTAAGALLAKWPPERRAPLAFAALAVAAAAFVATIRKADAHVRGRVATVTSMPSIGRGQLESALHVLAKEPHGRLWAGGSLGTGNHWWMYLPAVYAGQPALRAFAAAAAPSSANFEYLLHFDHERHAALFGVRYVLARKEKAPQMDGAIRIWETQDFVLLSLPNARHFSPVTIVGSVPASRWKRKPEILRWMRGFDPVRGRHLELGGAGLPSSSPQKAAVPQGRVLKEWVRRSSYGAEVEVGGAAPVTFRLSVTYHPDWRAWVDGKPARVRRLSPDIMGVDVPPGRHEVDFRFNRSWWSAALLLASAGLLGTVALHERRRTRPRV